MVFDLTVPGAPVSKLRPRVTWHHVYTPKRTKDWEEMVGWLATQEMTRKGLLRFDGCLGITVRFYIPMPKWWSKKVRASRDLAFHTQTPDIDNLVKGLLDGLQGVVFRDDKQVAQSMATKQWTDLEGWTELRIASL